MSIRILSRRRFDLRDERLGRPGRYTWLVAGVAAVALTACNGGGTVPWPSGSTGSTTTSSTTGGSTTSATTTPTASATTTGPSGPATPSTSQPAPPTTSTGKPATTTGPTPPRACLLPPGTAGKDLSALPTTRKVVALTFDAGANADAVTRILATLKAKGVPGTFFLTGEFARSYPAQSRAMAAYPIGNHTMTHPDLTKLTRAQVVNEIRAGADAIRQVVGRTPGPYFRFPYGAVDKTRIGIVNDECYGSFRWTVDTLGWKGTSSGITAASVVQRVRAAAQPGMIVLMHVGSHPTDHSTLDADALPTVIDQLRAAGYGFVTLADW